MPRQCKPKSRHRIAPYSAHFHITNADFIEFVSNHQQCVHLIISFALRLHRITDGRPWKGYQHRAAVLNGTQQQTQQWQVEQTNQQQLSAASSTAPMNTNASLLSLNDHVLIEILRQLSVNDLNATAVTCDRLHRIARTVFRLYHKTYSLNLNLNQKMLFYDYGRDYDLAIVRMLSNFGESLASIVLRDSYKRQNNQFARFVLNLIVKYCTAGGALEQLQLHAIRFHHRHKRTIAAPLLFANVRELSLNYTNALSYSALADCSQLVKLTVHCLSAHVFIAHHFPRLATIALDEVQIDSCPKDEMRHKWTEFFQRHRQLTNISLSSIHQLDLMAIADFEQLHTIYINCINSDIMHLTNLNRLRSVTMYEIKDNNITAFLNDLVCTDTLEYLDIHAYGRTQVDTFMHGITRFAHLTVLKFNAENELNDAQLRLLRALKQLNELIIRNPMSITGDGLILLVTELDRLQLLILQNDFEPEVRLLPNTFSKLCRLYETRNRMLIVKNTTHELVDRQFADDAQPAENGVQYYQYKHWGARPKYFYDI